MASSAPVPALTNGRARAVVNAGVSVSRVLSERRSSRKPPASAPTVASVLNQPPAVARTPLKAPKSTPRPPRTTAVPGEVRTPKPLGGPSVANGGTASLRLNQTKYSRPPQSRGAGLHTVHGSGRQVTAGAVG